MAALGIVITVFNLRLYLREDQSETPKWLQCLTFTMLLKLNCKSKKVKNASGNDQVVSMDDDLELQDINDGRKSLKPIMNQRPQSPDGQGEVGDFPFECKEVAVFLDCFFFYLFNVITFIVTMSLFITMAVCDVPPI